MRAAQGLLVFFPSYSALKASYAAWEQPGAACPRGPAVVPGSPFLLRVRPGPAAATHSIAQGSGLSDFYVGCQRALAQSTTRILSGVGPHILGNLGPDVLCMGFGRLVFAQIAVSLLVLDARQ